MKSSLEEKVAVLEHELLLSQSRAKLLEDQTTVKQDTIDTLVTEVALLKRQSASGYSDTSIFKQPEAHPGSSKYTYPWPLSLCLGSSLDSDESADAVVDEDHNLNRKNRRLVATQSMLLDTKMYSTKHEQMSVAHGVRPSTGSSASDTLNSAPDDIAASPAGSNVSDMERLMKNGPILVRPGKPLAYVDDTGNIVEVDVDVNDLPPMM